MNPSDAFGKFHEEHMAFSRARNYLFYAHRASLRGTDGLSEEHKEFSERISSTYKDPEEYFVTRLFISHVAAFELFLQELVTCVVARHPQKVGSIQFKLSEILEIDDPEALVRRAAEEVLNKLMYKKPLEYLNELSELLSFDCALVATSWPVFVEAKARRDLGVHNGWVCNRTYLNKLREANIPNQLGLGESALPTSRDYIASVERVLYDLAKLLKDEVMRKHWKL